MDLNEEKQHSYLKDFMVQKMFKCQITTVIYKQYRINSKKKM